MRWQMNCSMEGFLPGGKVHEEIWLQLLLAVVLEYSLKQGHEYAGAVNQHCGGGISSVVARNVDMFIELGL